MFYCYFHKTLHPSHILLQFSAKRFFSTAKNIPTKNKVNYELELIEAKGNPGVILAHRSDFLLQKGDTRNSAVVALRRPMDGPQQIDLKLLVTVSHSRHRKHTYMHKIRVYVSRYRSSVNEVQLQNE